MARRSGVRDIPPDVAISSDDTASPREREAVITNIWTLTSRSAKQIGKEVIGETAAAPPPALRALFRGTGRR
jgi:hypothetical protein